MKNIQSLSFLLWVLWLLNPAILSGQVKIAVSKPSPTYIQWLKSADSTIIPMGMYHLQIDSAVESLSRCSGLLLTGGEDVNPNRYGKQNELKKCEEIDEYRDSLEFALIRRALELKMPILGICRGEQILNVALGGTLYTDIPTDIDTLVIHRCPPDSKECLHAVNIQPGTLLASITKSQSGMVNSYHHQAVEKSGPGIRITAFSDNKVPEAIESDGSIYTSFLLGVQWHPERLIQNPGLSKPLAGYFIQKVKGYKTNKK